MLGKFNAYPRKPALACGSVKEEIADVVGS